MSLAAVVHPDCAMSDATRSEAGARRRYGKITQRGVMDHRLVGRQDHHIFVWLVTEDGIQRQESYGPSLDIPWLSYRGKAPAERPINHYSACIHPT
eukprot:2222643-Rhodomonas_salina.1